MFERSYKLSDNAAMIERDSIKGLLMDAARHYNRRELKDAERLCLRILRRNPLQAQAWHLIGVVALASGDYAAAQERLVRAAAAGPNPQVLVDLSAAAMHNGDLTGAIIAARHALALSSVHPEAHYNLGTALHWSGNYEPAAASLREALRLKPDFQPARINLGRSLLALGRYEEASLELEQVIATRPDHAGTLLFCAIAYHEQGEFERAIECYERAARLQPDAKDILGNMANAWRDCGKFERAAKLFERVLELIPGEVHAQNDYSHALLALGKFERGWPLYEARWEANDRPERAAYPQPLWQGESLAGKDLLVWGEQGIGDQMMFAGLLPEILRDARACTLLCEAKLLALFRRTFPAARVEALNSEAALEARAASFDFQVPIASLGRHLRRSLADFPPHDGYLRADPVKVAAWRDRLAAIGGKPKIGLSWRGGFVMTRKHLRSIPLEQWLPILRLPGLEFVSLQYTDCAAELEALRSQHGVTVHHWPEAIEDYDETAALVAALDLVLSVCTAAVHLSGALGRAAWVLVPAVPEWRYMREGERMPWYPSVRLFRQERVGVWTPLIERIAAQIQAPGTLLTPGSGPTPG